MSYVIDVYRGHEKAQKNIINVGLYIAFFPQLIAGPIVRYGSVAEQIENRTHTFENFSAGAWRFTIGLSKKLILANQLASVADLTFGGAGRELSVALSWIGALSFMLQIYYDFSGYSDMAIGLGLMFGFKFPENFNYPYISKSVTEYWRRWHISLGSWFRDYLYYPLSLGPGVKIRKAVLKKTNRKTAAAVSSFFTLFIVWISTGIWHGANWTFVVWGLIQFICIYLEQYKKPLKNKKADNILGFVSTFFIVLLGKVIFKADSLSAAFSYYGSMFHLNGNKWGDRTALYWLGQYKLFLVAGIIFIFPIAKKISEKVPPKWEKAYDILRVISMAALFVLDITYAMAGTYNPFIYFNF